MAPACDLQSCLTKHTYTPEKCDHALRRLYECCQRLYDSTGGESTVCPKPFVVKRWLKDHPIK
ncbi:hypothetical protein P691DRAFT_712344 [Macrolepiota fuliginosa MF-IS2]|uniref:Cx9C motif-containing protein 4, mitochondrial n=1 Tax=Macrolepiota fuliginosa MF-IS2 TaxID=1400762 RepID=A0A9P5X439_9AGAR|nr:hypothetical protein P691DRAFT_712344 [Macrolepiota fuliginosa MF-IS2]